MMVSRLPETLLADRPALICWSCFAGLALDLHTTDVHGPCIEYSNVL